MWRPAEPKERRRHEHERNLEDDDMRPEYDFSKGVRGKYANRFPKDAVMLVLAPDVAEVLPDSDSVNEALRVLVKAAKKMTLAAWFPPDPSRQSPPQVVRYNR
jgi:hypothetical protein